LAESNKNYGVCVYIYRGYFKIFILKNLYKPIFLKA